MKESTHRIERAKINSEFARPQDHVVINLAPAELPKSQHFCGFRDSDFLPHSPFAVAAIFLHAWHVNRISLSFALLSS